MLNNEQLIIRWSPALLRMELDKWLWNGQESVPIKKVWECLSSYCYLPRLKDVNVLTEAIRSGMESSEYFAYAEGITEGRYLGLKFNQSANTFAINMNGYLVKPEAAKKQIEGDREAARNESTGAAYPEPQPPVAWKEGQATEGEQSISPPIAVTPPGRKQPKRFYASVNLDTSRLGSHAGRINEEIIQHLSVLPGADVEVNIEITIKAPQGVPENVIRVVTENCRTLKFKQYGFEEE